MILKEGCDFATPKGEQKIILKFEFGGKICSFYKRNIRIIN